MIIAAMLLDVRGEDERPRLRVTPFTLAVPGATWSKERVREAAQAAEALVQTEADRS